jgi:hypothetical protein
MASIFELSTFFLGREKNPHNKTRYAKMAQVLSGKGPAKIGPKFSALSLF